MTNPISFALGSAGSAIASLGSLSQALGASQETIESFNAAAVATDGTIRLLTQAFGLFVGQNEEMNQSLLRTQALLQTNTTLYDRNGSAITDLREGLLASRGKLRQTLEELQIDSQKLVGVTSNDVNAIFGIVSRNINNIIGQSKKLKDPLDAVKELTVSLTAAAGAQGLRPDQVAQEARALLTGDLNNPDAVIAKGLGITKDQFAQAQAQGRAIDLVLERLEAYKVANAEAAKSISGITSNIQDFFELVTRRAGEQALAPIVEGLGEIESFLKDNQAAVEQGLAVAVGQLVELFLELYQAVKDVAVVLQPSFEIFRSQFGDAVGNTVEGFKGLAQATQAIAKSITAAITPLNKFLSSEQFATLVELYKNPIQGVQDFAANNLNPFRVIANVAQGQKDIFKTGAQDAAEAFDIVERAGQASVDYMAKLRRQLGSTGTVEVEKAKLAIAGLEDQIKNLQGVQLFSQEGRQKQSAAIEQAKQQIADFRAELKKANVDLEGDITIGAKALQDRGKLVEQTRKELTQLQAEVSRVTREGGDQATFDKNTQQVVKAISQARELGAISRDEAISSLEAVVSNEKIALDVRSQAHQQILKFYKERADVAKESIAIEQAAAQKLAATGKISSEQADVVNQRGEIAKVQADLRAAEDELRNKRALGAEAGSAERRVRLLNEQVEAARGRLVDIESKALVAEVDRSLQQADNLVKERLAKRRVVEAGLVESLLSEQAAVSSLLTEITQVSDERQQAQNELNKLSAVAQPASLAARLQLEQRINKARLNFLNLTEKAIKLEIQLADARFKASLRSIEEDEETRAQATEAQAANARLLLTKQIRDEKISRADAAAEQISLDLRVNKQKLDNARQLLSDLEKLEPPASAESREQLSDRLFKARMDVSQLTQNAVEAEIRLQDLNYQRKQRLLEIEQQRFSLQTEAIALTQRVGEMSLRMLDQEIELMQKLESLEESRLQLAVVRQSNQVSIYQEALKLRKLESEAREKGDVAVAEEAARQQKQLGVSPNTRDDQVARKQFAEQIELIQVQLKLEQSKLGFAQQTLAIEQQKTQLALQQEKIAAKRAVIESEIKISELQLKREQIKQNRELTSEEKQAQLGLNDQQIGIQQVGQAFNLANVAFTNGRESQIGRIQATERQTLNNQQMAQIEQTNASTGQQIRAARIEYAQTGGQLQGIRTDIPRLQLPTPPASPVEIKQSPELVQAIGKLNGLLETVMGQKSKTVQVNNYYPDLTTNRAAQRLAGY